MDNIIELKPKEKKWLNGPAVCMECKHEWQAAAEVGTNVMECPECNTYKGTWQGIVEPPAERWECGSCEGQLFFVTPEGFCCAKCGLDQNF